MWDDTITPEDVRGRSRVSKLVPTNLAEAISAAKAIKHPWYRCQSLATAAEQSLSLNQKHALLREAFDAAQLQEEINRAVTVSAWPLRILVTLDPKGAEAKIMALVRQANCEPHTLRRADALFSLAAAVQSNESLLSLIVPSLIQALVDGRGWRIDRLIRYTVVLLKGRMATVIDELVAAHSENGKKQKLVASLNGHEI